MTIIKPFGHYEPGARPRVFGLLQMAYLLAFFSMFFHVSPWLSLDICGIRSYPW
jgi:hypothetical protein